MIKQSLAVKPEPMAKPAMVISRLDYPVTLSYETSAIIIPPRGRELVANYEKLGGYPKGIAVLPLKK